MITNSRTYVPSQAMGVTSCLSAGDAGRRAVRNELQVVGVEGQHHQAVADICEGQRQAQLRALLDYLQNTAHGCIGTSGAERKNAGAFLFCALDATVIRAKVIHSAIIALSDSRDCPVRQQRLHHKDLKCKL